MNRSVRRRAHVWTGRAALAASASLMLSCGGGSPSGPAPGPPPPNQPPVIRSIVIEPARVEVDEEVAVNATVEDAETAPGSLTYEWSADAGTFSGEGASVKWRAPADGATPADVTLRLTVIERYGRAGGQAEHRISGSSPAVRVHDSPKELRDMSLRFLELFADSDRTPSECLVDFSDSCRGKESERRDIENNRRYYNIRSSSFEFERVQIAADRMRANMVVECEFRSRFVRCPPEHSSCVVGASERISGDCLLTAVYENNRWWLCDSNFDADESSRTIPLRFFGLD